MKLFLVCVALLGVVSSVPLKGRLEPRFAEVRNHPEATQGYRRRQDCEESKEHGYDLDSNGEPNGDCERLSPKYSPGPGCGQFEDCLQCGSANKGLSTNKICIWEAIDIHDDENKHKKGYGKCVERREEHAEFGLLLDECLETFSAEVRDEYDDEVDDQSPLHINGTPDRVDIAQLDRAEPVYTTALERGAGEGPDSEAGGDWLQEGMSHEEYEGHLSVNKKHAANQDNSYLNDGYHKDNGIVFDKGQAGYSTHAATTTTTTEAPPSTTSTTTTTPYPTTAPGANGR